MTYREFFNETNNNQTNNILNEMRLETAITNPISIFQKNVTLYHGTPKRIPTDIIDPAYGIMNVGTKLSRPRYSTWWVKDPFFAYWLSTNKVLIILAKKYGIIQPDTKITVTNVEVLNKLGVVDMDHKNIYINEKYKKEYIDMVNNLGACVYSITVPWGIVGRGHDPELSEYTLDQPVKAKPTKVTFNELKKYMNFYFVPESELILRSQKIKSCQPTTPLINRLVYYKYDDKMNKRKSFRPITRRYIERGKK